MGSKKHSFIDQKIKELYHSEPMAISEAMNRVRCIMRKHRNYKDELIDTYYKHLFHEIIPIISVMKHLGYDAEKIEFTGRNSQAQIDGILHLPDGRQQNIEVRTAINPEDESKSRRHYLQYGYEPIPNQRAKTRPLEDLSCELEKNPSLISAKGHDDEFLFPTIQKSLCDKVQKSDKNKSYHGAWLILVIDDHIPPPSIDAATRLRRFDPLCQRLLASEDQWRPFSRVFVVGISGTYLFDSEARQGYILPQCGGRIFEEPITD